MANKKAPKKLKALFTIVPRGKKDIFIDLIEGFDVNAHMAFYGKGTASDEILNMLGLDTRIHDVIVSIIREDMVRDCILAIEDKLSGFKNINGIAFAVPLESLIGNVNYLMLAGL